MFVAVAIRARDSRVEKKKPFIDIHQVLLATVLVCLKRFKWARQNREKEQKFALWGKWIEERTTDRTDWKLGHQFEDNLNGKLESILNKNS